MPEPTIGQQEDDRAFEEMVAESSESLCWSHGNFPDQISQEAFEEGQRLAFAAGMERGEEKRGERVGCCHE